MDAIDIFALFIMFGTFAAILAWGLIIRRDNKRRRKNHDANPDDPFRQ